MSDQRTWISHGRPIGDAVPHVTRSVSEGERLPLPRLRFGLHAGRE